MWGSKNRRIAELQDRVAQLVDERDAALRAVETERTARSIAVRQFCEAAAANKRIHGRNVHLTEQLERAREDANDGALDEMGARLDRALRACARYRADADGQARLNRNQQQLLDTFYGLDTPAIAEGAQWQQRRHDRLPGVKL
ncbi:hypothetical protein [Streptomyces sp. DASNCL29]|uniref:hypothetical protein n=1 Tax=Streptomyces sp. DASNCL29 TaxID=2583819 RepID=UPI00110FD5AE|nr:hypothetical protein [Streptomyces sp. DASNCL29]TMU98063.1 hypothetical protein FGK60_09515 [Streptomyces sp. DASNCL29]